MFQFVQQYTRDMIMGAVQLLSQELGQRIIIENVEKQGAYSRYMLTLRIGEAVQDIPVTYDTGVVLPEAERPTYFATVIRAAFDIPEPAQPEAEAVAEEPVPEAPPADEPVAEVIAQPEAEAVAEEPPAPKKKKK